MTPAVLPKHAVKRFAILALVQEFAWVRAREIVKDLHQQGVDVTEWLVARVLIDSGWSSTKLDDRTVVWFNPDVELPQVESVAKTGVVA